MTAVGFEPAQIALVELESTPLDHSGKVSCYKRPDFRRLLFEIDCDDAGGGISGTIEGMRPAL